MTSSNKPIRTNIYFHPFHATGLFLYFVKTLENLFPKNITKILGFFEV